MLRLTANYSGKLWHFPIYANAMTIGSSAASDHVLPVPGISHKHLRLERMEGGVRLIDLSSKKGLDVRGQKFDCIELKRGSSVRVGGAILSLEDIPTSEVDLSIVLAVSSAPGVRQSERGFATSADVAKTSDVSPVVALNLVRQIEKCGLDPADASYAESLEAARRLLEVRWLATATWGEEEGLVRTERSSPAILSHAGELPPQDDLYRAAAKARIAEDVVTDDEGFIVCRIGTGDAFLAGARFHLDRSAEPWQLDLFGFLTQKLASTYSCRRSSTQRATPRVHRELILPGGFVAGVSVAMERLLESIRATVNSRLDVLLLGETGTGKEHLARLIHDSGPTAKGPYIAINCAAIPTELLEAELFGVEARVATGVDPRSGLFVRAEGGSIFLDEIGDMSEPMQAKLLRALQEREVLPLGAHRPKRIDVRVISASNKLLRELVKLGRFRADLFYRLRGLQFHVPPLRERREDIPALVSHFAASSSRLYEKEIRGVTRQALELLLRHDWPGNVRELRNEVERAVLLAEPFSCLEERHFGPVRWLVEHPDSDATPSMTGMIDGAKSGAGDLSRSLPKPGPDVDLTLETQVNELEREMLRRAMAKADNNKSLAARLLGITRNGLALKLKRLDLDF